MQKLPLPDEESKTQRMSKRNIHCEYWFAMYIRYVRHEAVSVTRETLSLLSAPTKN